MSEKTRTWPYAVVEHPGEHERGLWNVRKLDGELLLLNGGHFKPLMQHLCDALNEAFDWGAEGRK